MNTAAALRGPKYDEQVAMIEGAIATGQNMGAGQSEDRRHPFNFASISAGAWVDPLYDQVDSQ